jgi:2-methylisocitrate lyase-like PEP mutase family enzyme
VSAEVTPDGNGTGHRKPMLKEQIAAGSLVLAPGCFDLISARVLRGAGHSVGYLTPFGFRAVTPPEATTWRNLIAAAGVITGETGLALIADAHSGIEGQRRPKALVQNLESAGCQAIVVEDRIGLGRDSKLRTPRSMTRHIDAILAARTGSCLVIARSDTVRISLREAINRCAAYLDAGADLVMPLMTPYLEFPRQLLSPEARLSPYRSLAAGLPAGQVVVHSPHGRHLPVERARELGFGIYLMPQLLVASAVSGMQTALSAVSRPGADQDDQYDISLLDPIPLSRLLTVDSWLRARW